jgi:hypothetical protein
MSTDSFLTDNKEEAEMQIRLLEARGDFRFKNITKVYEIILKMTSEFAFKRALPTVSSLSKLTDLDNETIAIYLKELINRKVPIIGKITIVENNPNNDGVRGIPELRTHDLFCRPSAQEKYSTQLYITDCNQRSLHALKEYFTKKFKPKDENAMRTYLHENINKQTFHTTYIPHILSRLFSSKFDMSLELRKNQRECTIKPLMKQLISDRILFFTKNQTGKELFSQNIILLQNKTELITRYKILNEYFHQKILSLLIKEKYITTEKIQAITKDASEESTDSEKDIKLYNLAYPHILKDKGNVDFQILSELMIFAPILAVTEKKQAKTELLNFYLDTIKNYPRVLDLKTFKFDGNILPDKIRFEILSHPKILSVEFPFKKRIGLFAAHKDNLQTVIQSAKTAAVVNNNETEIHILNMMGIDKYLDESVLKDFDEFLVQVLSRYLSFFSRIFNFLFRKKPKKEQLKIIKKELSSHYDKRLENVRKIELAGGDKEARAKKKRRSVREDPDADSADSKKKDKITEDNSDMTPEEKEEIEKETQEAEKKLGECVGQIERHIDDFWKKGVLPNRISVKELFPTWTEDQLMMFMKRHCRGKVKSFQVNFESDKFKWPIFMTKKYLTRYGSKLLHETKKKADEQRKAQFPNQETFEYYYALENFLSRNLRKL